MHTLKSVAILALAAGLALTLSGAVQADQPPAKDAPKGAVDFRALHPWGRFKPGSWVKTKTTSTERVITPGTADIKPLETVLERKSTLKEAQEHTYVLDISEGTERNPQTQTRAFRWDGGLAEADAAPDCVREDREEEVEAVGEKWPCRYIKVEVQGLQGKVTIETWFSPKAPGGWVKQIIANDTGGLDNNVILLLEKKKDTVGVAGKKIACWVIRRMENVSGAAEPQLTTLWRSAEVPGHDVKSQSTRKTADFQYDTVMEMTGFQAKR